MFVANSRLDNIVVMNVFHTYNVEMNVFNLCLYVLRLKLNEYVCIYRLKLDIRTGVTNTLRRRAVQKPACDTHDMVDKTPAQKIKVGGKIMYSSSLPLIHLVPIPLCVFYNIF